MGNQSIQYGFQSSGQSVMRLHRLYKAPCFCWLALLNAAMPVYGQYSKEAQAALSSASKVAVKAVQTSPQAGDPVDFDVQIQDARGQPATLPDDTDVDIQLLGSSGNVVLSGTCRVPAKTTDGKCTLKAPDAGVYKIRAQTQKHNLLDGTGYVMVRPKAAVQKKKGTAPQAAVEWYDPAPSRRRAIPILLAAYRPEPEPQQPPASGVAGCDPPKSHSKAKVVLTITEGGENGGAFRADLDSATIVGFFQAEDGGSAPSEILVWLSPDHGDLDQQPLVIHACSIMGETHLQSKYPVQSSISYTVVPGTYAVDAPPKLQASFVRPIIGIGVQPDGTQTLSLIDRPRMLVQFFDADGSVVLNDQDRTVQFVSNNSVIGAKDESIKLKAGDDSASTLLLPFWVGQGAINVSTDRLKPTTHTVQVVGETLLIVCLLGGLMGGLVSFFATGGSVYRRLIVGIVSGIVLTWAYVFELLPRVDVTVAHNYISVFVVSVLGGYLGIKAIDMVLKQLGWAT